MISKKDIVEFLQSPDIQALLSEENLDKVYSLYEERVSNKLQEYSCTLTQYLLSIGIQPLDYVTHIREGMFIDCSIEEIHIPGNMGDIPGYVFVECDKLKKVIIEPGVTHIINDAFDGCDNLTEVVIPKTVRVIGDLAFIDCSPFIIKCFENSEGHKFALRNGYDFELM